ncbi:MAG: glycosyltransferase family 25 protein [Alphaproteobacteria bacterium]
MKIKIYIINLKRSKHRRKHMAEQLKATKIKYDFVDAVDGKNKDKSDFKQYNQNTINITGKDLKPTEIGAFLSHEKAIKQAKTDKVDWAIVLEDDVVVSKHFNDILRHIENNKSLDVIRMYVRNAGIAQTPTYTEKRNTYGNWGGALGYAISKSGVNKFLKVSDNFSIKIDNFLFGYWLHGLKICQTDKNLVDIENTIDSDIGYNKTDKPATKPLTRLVYKVKYFIQSLTN